MSKLTRSDIIPYEQYKNLHQKFLKEVIAEKKLRRVSISEKMAGLFESKLTVLYQIQEMIRAEKMTKEEYIEEMLEVYNDLLPEVNEISMTLFVEIPNQEELRSFNKTIVGIETAVELVFADEVITSYEPDQDEEEDENYTQSVHYLHFSFNEEQKAKFMDAKQISLKVNHKNYQAQTELPEDLVKELQKQLANNQ